MFVLTSVYCIRIIIIIIITYNSLTEILLLFWLGNALAKTVLEESGEEYSTINAALLAVYGGYVPYDIAIAENETEKLYFFMSKEYLINTVYSA